MSGSCRWTRGAPGAAPGAPVSPWGSAPACPRSPHPTERAAPRCAPSSRGAPGPSTGRARRRLYRLRRSACAGSLLGEWKCTFLRASPASHAKVSLSRKDEPCLQEAMGSTFIPAPPRALHRPPGACPHSAGEAPAWVDRMSTAQTNNRAWLSPVPPVAAVHRDE